MKSVGIYSVCKNKVLTTHIKNTYSPSIMEKTPDHKKLVALENSLIPAFAHIGHGEKRFLAYCIAQLDATREKAIGRIQFRATDYAKIFAMPLSNVYDEIREKADALNSRSFRRYENGIHKTDAWVFWSEYREFTGEIEVQLNERLTPLLLDLKEKQYIQFALSNAKDFSNVGWSLYVILKQWLKAGHQDFELDELKALIGVSGKYKRWAEFSRQIIVPAVENITDVSDLKASYVKMRRGRSVVGLSFTISRKRLDAPQADIDIESPEKQIYATLTMGGLHQKTINSIIETGKQHDRLYDLLKKSEQLIETHGGKGQAAKIKAITGSLNSFIASWGQLSLFSEPVPTAKTRAVDSAAIRKCIAEKRNCEIRRTKQARNEMCQDCLELYPEG